MTTIVPVVTLVVAFCNWQVAIQGTQATRDLVDTARHTLQETKRHNRAAEQMQHDKVAEEPLIVSG